MLLENSFKVIFKVVKDLTQPSNLAKFPPSLDFMLLIV